MTIHMLKQSNTIFMIKDSSYSSHLCKLYLYLPYVDRSLIQSYTLDIR